MSEWKPIETAPKDGSIFLAFDGDWIEVCRFSKFDYWSEQSRGRLPIYLASDEDRSFCDATHWMPLPEPPHALPSS